MAAVQWRQGCRQGDVTSAFEFHRTDSTGVWHTAPSTASQPIPSSPCNFTSATRKRCDGSGRSLGPGTTRTRFRAHFRHHSFALHPIWRGDPRKANRAIFILGDLILQRSGPAWRPHAVTGRAARLRHCLDFHCNSCANRLICPPKIITSTQSNSKNCLRELRREVLAHQVLLNLFVK